jgi:hypothetical protein
MDYYPNLGIDKLWIETNVTNTLSDTLSRYSTSEGKGAGKGEKYQGKASIPDWVDIGKNTD